MKTKIIPFDLETAKKIQDGKIKGKIKTQDDGSARIVCWDRNGKQPIVALVKREEDSDEITCYYTLNGKWDYLACCESVYDLVLEVPDDEPQFKPFDRVLVRDDKDSVWRANLFSHFNDNSPFPYACAMFSFRQCIPYEGNEELVGTTKKPKEE